MAALLWARRTVFAVCTAQATIACGRIDYDALGLRSDAAGNRDRDGGQAEALAPPRSDATPLPRDPTDAPREAALTVDVGFPSRDAPEIVDSATPDLITVDRTMPDAAIASPVPDAPVIDAVIPDAGVDVVPRADTSVLLDRGPDLPPGIVITGQSADCLRFTYQARPYAYCTRPLIWTAAVAACQAMGMNLGIYESAAEEGVVGMLAIGDVWMGLSDRATEGSFVRLDGRPLLYTNWQPNEPNNTGPAPGEDCVYARDTRGWNDANCADPRVYLCK